MEITVTTQLENLIVTLHNADMSSSTQTHTDSTAATLSLDKVCKTEDCNDGDSKDTDRYLHTNTLGVGGKIDSHKYCGHGFYDSELIQKRFVRILKEPKQQNSTAKARCNMPT